MECYSFVVKFVTTICALELFAIRIIAILNHGLLVKAASLMITTNHLTDALIVRISPSNMCRPLSRPGAHSVYMARESDKQKAK